MLLFNRSTGPGQRDNTAKNQGRDRTMILRQFLHLDPVGASYFFG
jgi:hypothetical protein